MNDLGNMRHFLVVEVKQLECGMFIHRQKYANEILTRFVTENCNKVCIHIVHGNKLTRDKAGKVVDSTKYKQMIWYSIFLLTTKPDLTFSVGLIARYLNRPIDNRLFATKRIIRYLRGTIMLGILYKRNTSLKL